MAPLVVFTIWATPAFPLPPWVSAGQFTVSPAPSVQAERAAAARGLRKFEVVREAWDRCAAVVAVGGNLAPGFRALISCASQVLTCRSKILAMVSASSTSLSTPETL